MTANCALGANCAFEDAASLTNGLQSLLSRRGHATGSGPTVGDLTRVFGAYEKEQKGRAKFCKDFTGLYTRFATWQNWFFKVQCLYLAPVIGDQFVADWVFSRVPRDGVKLDFVAESDAKGGKIKYSK
jgi:2-polyprenyl-6-methoxyphenol hydroxylase-like FAD-dependent oxidoreductase